MLLARFQIACSRTSAEMQEEDFGTSWTRRKSGSGPAKARRIRTDEKCCGENVSILIVMRISAQILARYIPRHTSKIQFHRGSVSD